MLISDRWLTEVFIPKTDFGRPRFLLLDGHTSHVSPQFIRALIDAKIEALCLPPHTTHLIQPLDVGVFSPYSIAYKQEVDNANRGGITGINKAVFLRLLKRSREKSLSPSNIRSGWRGAGLIPFHPTVVLEKLPKYPIIRPKTPPPSLTAVAATPTNSKEVERLQQALIEGLPTIKK